MFSAQLIISDGSEAKALAITGRLSFKPLILSIDTRTPAEHEYLPAGPPVI